MANPKLQVEIGAKIDALKKGLSDASASVTAFSSEVSNRMSGVADSIQSVAIPAGIAAAAMGAMGLSAVKAFGRLESLEKGLAAVAGSTDAAKKQLDDLREVAKLPGLGLEEAVRGSISLQAIGISADVAKNAILQFGNAVATVGKGRAELDRALYGLQQLANTDFPLGEDLNIIKDAIPQVSKLLDEAFGANRSDALAKMGVTSQQVVDVILEGLAGLPRVAGGVENAFENMGDSLTEAWQEIGKAINDSLNFEGALNKVGDALGGMVTWFRNLSPVARDMIVYFAAGTAGTLALVAALGAIVTIAPIVFGAVTLMTGGIAAVVAAVAVAAIAIANNWYNISRAIQEHNARILSNLSKFSGVLASFAKTLGATNVYASLTAAQIGLSVSSKNLNKRLIDERKAFFDSSNAAYADMAATKLDADAKEKLATGTNKATEATKRLGLEIWKLNAIQRALNGKEITEKGYKAPQTIGAMDRGVTIAIPELQISGIISQAQAVAEDAAAVFNEYFSSNIGAMIGEGLSNIATGIGQAIANGGNVIEAFGRGLLQSFGNFLSEFGKQLITYGIAAGAFGKLMASIASLNPAAIIPAAGLAVAAGAALSVLGAAVAAAGSGNGIAGQGSQNQTISTGTAYEPAPIRSQEQQDYVILRNGDLMAAVGHGIRMEGYGS